ncbi:beta-glucosidase 1A [Coccomyxa sp. Obi]|nr:beta-glucosidase 1A [Coccomyxa sp. Obi]
MFKDFAGMSQAPPPFYLGFASSALQMEGANATDGRGPSIFNTAESLPGHGDTSAVADDFYHLYPIDIAAMQLLGVKHFRLSISWSRIIPDGDGAVNQKGLDFYARLLDALRAAGIEPLVCLYHWDLPQALQSNFGGWASDQIVPAFVNYARVVFQALGDKSVYWSTVNEPINFCFLHYAAGMSPLFIHDLRQAWNCSYNVLRAHAAAVKEFRAAVPGGRISMCLNSEWGQPLTNSTADADAAQRRMEYELGMFADPIYKGDYPASMKQRISFLPKITPQLAHDLNGSMDYFGLNFYTAVYVAADEGATCLWGPCDFTTSQTDKAGNLIGAEADSSWLKFTPWAFRPILNWISNRYHPKEIVVTETGWDVKGEDAMPLAQALNDTSRSNFFRDYIPQAADAVNIDKVPMTGYFVWSLLDNYKFGSYAIRFGVAHVDYKIKQRTFKASAMYLAGIFNSSMANESLTYPAVA